jgi:hypothetical protein
LWRLKEVLLPLNSLLQHRLLREHQSVGKARVDDLPPYGLYRLLAKRPRLSLHMKSPSSAMLSCDFNIGSGGLSL